MLWENASFPFDWLIYLKVVLKVINDMVIGLKRNHKHECRLRNHDLPNKVSRNYEHGGRAAQEKRRTPDHTNTSSDSGNNTTSTKQEHNRPDQPGKHLPDGRISHRCTCKIKEGQKHLPCNDDEHEKV